MIISISSLKGGVGKSTIAQNLAVCFAHQGYQVCIADADTNQSCLRWSSNRKTTLPPIPVSGLPDGKILAKNVRILEEMHEIVIIDGTPNLSPIASKIIILADVLIIPILPGAMDIWATEKFLERYNNAVMLKEQSIPAFFLLNQFNERITINKETKEILDGSDIELLKTQLGNRVAYKEANVNGCGVYEYDHKKSKEETIKLSKEIESIMTNLDRYQTEGYRATQLTNS